VGFFIPFFSSDFVAADILIFAFLGRTMWAVKLDGGAVCATHV